MSPGIRKFTASLLASTTLGGAVVSAGATPHHSELDSYILQALAEPENDPTEAVRAQRSIKGSELLKEIAEHDKKGEALIKSLPSPFNTSDPKDRETLRGMANELRAIKELNTQWAGLYAGEKEELARSIDAMRSKAGVKAPVIVDLYKDPEEFNADAAFSNLQLNDGKLHFTTTSRYVDDTTPAEKEFTLAHEVAGHFKNDLTDAEGLTRHRTVKEALQELQRSNDPELLQESRTREERADRAAIQKTCNPEAAVRVLVKAEANIKDIALEELKRDPAGIIEKLTDDSPSARAHDHPYWKDRVQYIREEAEKSCPPKTR